MRLRQRRRPLLVERGHQHVRRHDRWRRRASIGRPERHELDLAQPLRRMLDERQLEMRIGARVAVTGKMLAAGRDALGLQRADDGGAQPRDLVGLLRTARDRR